MQDLLNLSYSEIHSIVNKRYKDNFRNQQGWKDYEQVCVQTQENNFSA